MKKYLGTITKTKGYSGQLIVADLAYSISIQPDTKVFIGFSENFTKEFEISDWDLKTKKAFLRLTGIDDDIKASKFAEQGIFIDEVVLQNLIETEDKIDLDNNYILIEQNGNIIGTIAEQWELPANDVWLVKTDKGDLLVPVLEQNILHIDESKNTITYEMIDGLMELLDEEKSDNE
jgi:16S rRNA processing protein RimM